MDQRQPPWLLSVPSPVRGTIPPRQERPYGARQVEQQMQRQGPLPTVADGDLPSPSSDALANGTGRSALDAAFSRWRAAGGQDFVPASAAASPAHAPAPPPPPPDYSGWSTEALLQQHADTVFDMALAPVDHPSRSARLRAIDALSQCLHDRRAPGFGAPAADDNGAPPTAPSAPAATSSAACAAADDKDTSDRPYVEQQKHEFMTRPHARKATSSDPDPTATTPPCSGGTGRGRHSRRQQRRGPGPRS